VTGTRVKLHPGTATGTTEGPERPDGAQVVAWDSGAKCPVPTSWLRPLDDQTEPSQGLGEGGTLMADKAKGKKKASYNTAGIRAGIKLMLKNAPEPTDRKQLAKLRTNTGKRRIEDIISDAATYGNVVDGHKVVRAGRGKYKAEPVEDTAAAA
jgi:hypothetical protein